MVHCPTVHLPLGALLSRCTVCGAGEFVSFFCGLLTDGTALADVYQQRVLLKFRPGGVGDALCDMMVLVDAPRGGGGEGGGESGEEEEDWDVGKESGGLVGE